MEPAVDWLSGFRSISFARGIGRIELKPISLRQADRNHREGKRPGRHEHQSKRDDHRLLMIVALSILKVGKPILEDGNPAYENDTCAAHQTGKKHNSYDAHCKDHQRVSHIEAN